MPGASGPVEGEAFPVRSQGPAEEGERPGASAAGKGPRAGGGGGEGGVGRVPRKRCWSRLGLRHRGPLPPVCSLRAHDSTFSGRTL